MTDVTGRGLDFPEMKDFLGDIFGPANVGQVWTTGFAQIETATWQGRAGLDWLEGKLGGAADTADLYFCIGLMRDGASRRAIGEVVAQPLLIVDDVGTKVPVEKWDALLAMGMPSPTFRVETSPGNETWGWVLDGDAKSAERWTDLSLIRAYLVDRGLTDNVMDEARYVRLPGGWNSKPKYRGAGGVGTPPAVKLISWTPGVKVDLGLVGRVLIGRADWRNAPVPTGGMTGAQLNSALGTGALRRTADMRAPEPIIQLAEVLGLNPVQTRPGVVEALCPNMAQHGDRADTGFAFLGGGLMQCQHASCQGLRSPDFRAMMEDAYDDQVAARLAVGLDMTGWARSAGEFLARADLASHGVAFDPGEVAKVVAEADDLALRQAESARHRALGDRLAVAREAATNRAKLTHSGLVPARAVASVMIPPRPWLYGRSVIAGFISVLVAPGGQGKSALMMTEAVAMATGLELLAGEKPVRPLRVWLFNGEDDLAEVERRLAATLMRFNLAHADLGGRLFLSSGRDMKIALGRTDRDGPELVPGVIDGLADIMTAAGIDVVVFDPLGAMLGVDENSNTSANTVLDGLRDLATRTGAAVILLHHTAKSAATDMDAAGVGAARGASAFVDGARAVRQLVRMTPKEAVRFGIGEEYRRGYLRVENGKSNLSRGEGSRWLHLANVGLGNGAGLWPQGDYIGVAEGWTPPTAASGTVSDLAAVQAALMVQTPARPRADHRARDWAGFVVADVLGLDIGQPGIAAADRTTAQAGAFARVRAMVDGWIASGGLARVMGRDRKEGRSTAFIEPGTPAILCDEPTEQAGELDSPDTALDKD